MDIVCLLIRLNRYCFATSVLYINNIFETKKEYEYELQDNLDIKIQMKSTVDTQFEDIIGTNYRL